MPKHLQVHSLMLFGVCFRNHQVPFREGNKGIGSVRCTRHGLEVEDARESMWIFLETAGLCCLPTQVWIWDHYVLMCLTAFIRATVYGDGKHRIRQRTSLAPRAKVWTWPWRYSDPVPGKYSRNKLNKWQEQRGDTLHDMWQ